MSDKDVERRLCQRFKIPGATVSYRKEKIFLFSKAFSEEFCPLQDISRGGARFLTQKLLKFKTKVFLQISIPGEHIPLNLIGQVRWASLNPGKRYRYQAGIQFNIYGEKKGQNYPGALVKVIALEQKFIEPGDTGRPGSKSEFSI